MLYSAYATRTPWHLSLCHMCFSTTASSRASFAALSLLPSFRFTADTLRTHRHCPSQSDHNPLVFFFYFLLLVCEFVLRLCLPTECQQLVSPHAFPHIRLHSCILPLTSAAAALLLLLFFFFAFSLVALLLFVCHSLQTRSSTCARAISRGLSLSLPLFEFFFSQRRRAKGTQTQCTSKSKRERSKRSQRTQQTRVPTRTDARVAKKIGGRAATVPLKVTFERYGSVLCSFLTCKEDDLNA